MKQIRPIFRALAKVGSRLLDGGVLRLERRLAVQDASQLKAKYRRDLRVEVFIEEIVTGSSGKKKVTQTTFEQIG